MNQKSELLFQITELGFALYDLILFLDTHPEDRNANALYEKYLQEYKEVRNKFVCLHGPLTAFDRNIGSLCKEGQADRPVWSWAEGPMPWEGGC